MYPSAELLEPHLLSLVGLKLGRRLCKTNELAANKPNVELPVHGRVGIGLTEYRRM